MLVRVFPPLKGYDYQQPHDRKPIQPTDDEIRARAYDIYLKRGGAPGREVEDWLQAECELKELPVPKTKEWKTP